MQCLVRPLARCENVHRIFDAEITGCITSQPMSLPKQCFELALYRWDCHRVGNLHSDEIQGFSRGTSHGTKHPALASGQWDKDDVVLTATYPFSLIFQYCNHGEGYISNPYRLTQAWSSIEKLLDDDGAHDRHLIPNFQFAFCKRSTAGETPFARDEVVCGNPSNICGPVFASCHDMCGMRKQGCGDQHIIEFTADRGSVFFCEGGLRSRFEPGPTRALRSRHYDQKIGSERPYLLGNIRLRTSSY